MRQNSQGEPFPAIDRRGRSYLLTPLYKATEALAKPAGKTSPKRAAADCVGILAPDGQDVRRAGKGRYFVTDPEGGHDPIALFSSHPKAV